MDKKDIIIKLDHVTKDYGRGRGLFDISLEIPRGSIFGYCGTNGSGKTTTLRHIMGFIKPDKGTVTVDGLDAWKDSEKIKDKIGYLPGEIAFPAVENGSQFLKSQAEMIHLKDMSKAERIINMMQLDPTANLRRMSKGMKQKTAIVAAFMGNPEIILLDEPTTGLDPLMRQSFVDLIMEEKKRGATIFMSNHMFDELEETCDYVAFIKDGRILDIVNMEDIHNRPIRQFKIVFRNKEDFDKVDFSFADVKYIKESKLKYVVDIKKDEADKLFDELSKFNISYIKEVKYSLEKYFMDHIAKDEEGD